MRIRYLTRHAPTPHAFSANPTGGPQRRLGATNLDSAEPRPWRKCRSFFLARSREQPVTPDAERPRYVSTSASTFRSLKQEYQDQRTRPLWPQPVPEPRAREDGLLALVDRFVKVAVVAALVALFVVATARGARTDSASAPTQVSKAPDRLTANGAPANKVTSVSFVGSTALADELMLLGKRYTTAVIVTQVVPAVDGHSSLVLDYKSALAKYFPGGGAGLRFSRGLCGRQRVDRGLAMAHTRTIAA
jgi:hypothetical protein